MRESSIKATGAYLMAKKTVTMAAAGYTPSAAQQSAFRNVNMNINDNYSLSSII